MKFEQMPPATVREGDKPAMREAIGLLQTADIDARRPSNSKHQLKLYADGYGKESLILNLDDAGYHLALTTSIPTRRSSRATSAPLMSEQQP